jgi:hypothetical protein
MIDHPTTLGGTVSARFDALRELFAARLASGKSLIVIPLKIGVG